MAAKAFFIGLIVLSGAGLAIQTAMNGKLKTTVESPVVAAIVSFAVGLLLLCLILQFSSFGHITEQFSTLRQAPWWAFLGGMVGCVFVMLAAVGVGRIGPAAVLTAAITGQVIGSIVLEHFGWLGVERTPATALRIFGAALLIAGVLIVQYQPKSP